MLLFSIFFFYKTNPIDDLKDNFEGIWRYNVSTQQKFQINTEINDFVSSSDQYYIHIYKNDFHENQNKEITDIFNIDLIENTTVKETTKSRTIQKYTIYFDRLESVFFYSSSSSNDKIQIKFDLTKLPQISTSGKYIDKYVFHYLLESQTKMHLSLFEIQNISESNSGYTGSWLQFDFIKDIDRSPLTIFEKSWQFILLASIFIIGYAIGYWKQNEELNQRIKAGINTKSASLRKIQKAKQIQN